MIGLRQGGVVPRHHCVAEEFIHGAFMRQHGVCRRGEIPIQHRHQFFRRLFFTITGEAADISEQTRDVHFLAADLKTVKVDLIEHCRRHHAFQQSALRFEFLAFGHVVQHNRDALSLLPRVFERRKIQAPIHVAARRRVVTHFEINDGLIRLTDFCQTRLKFF